MKKNKAFIIISIIIALVAVLVFSQFRNTQLAKIAQNTNSEGDAIQIIQELDGIPTGVKAPNLSLDSSANKKISLNEYQGKTLFLSVWRSNCPYCQKEAPGLVALHKGMQNNPDIEFLGISIDSNKKDSLAFIEKYKIPYPTLFDPGANTIQRSAALAIEGIPVVYIISPSGVVIGKFKGLHDWGMPSAIQKIKNLVSVLANKN